MKRIYADWLPIDNPRHWVGRKVIIDALYGPWYQEHVGDLPMMFNANDPVVIALDWVNGYKCAKCEWEHNPPRLNEVIRAWIPLEFLEPMEQRP